jgi:hypothetical protein
MLRAPRSCLPRRPHPLAAAPPGRRPTVLVVALLLQVDVALAGDLAQRHLVEGQERLVQVIVQGLAAAALAVAVLARGALALLLVVDRLERAEHQVVEVLHLLAVHARRALRARGGARARGAQAPGRAVVSTCGAACGAAQRRAGRGARPRLSARGRTWISSAASAKLRDGPQSSMAKVMPSSSSRYSSSSAAMSMSQLAARSRIGCSRYAKRFSRSSASAGSSPTAAMLAGVGARGGRRCGGRAFDAAGARRAW